jgi:hypothetical protein
MNKVNVKMIAAWVFGVALAIFGLWMFASFIDTNIHNGDLNYHYSGWNFFQVMLRLKGV